MLCGLTRAGSSLKRPRSRPRPGEAVQAFLREKTSGPQERRMVPGTTDDNALPDKFQRLKQATISRLAIQVQALEKLMQNPLFRTHHAIAALVGIAGDGNRGEVKTTVQYAAAQVGIVGEVEQLHGEVA